MSNGREEFFNDLIELLNKHEAEIFLDWEYSTIVLKSGCGTVSLCEVDERLRQARGEEE